MNSEIKKVLEKIEKNGFEAYIVGGFVRDYLLCHESNDVDICTNAVPKDIQTIFGYSKELGEYGSYNLKTNGFNYDITTYRKEYDYENRRPTEVEYTNNLLVDLERRDFTINAICMNQKGHILDPLNGVEDLESKLIRSIKDAKVKIQEDPLRILRAVRIACILDFNIESVLFEELKKNAKLILTLSKYRIKKELDAILISTNYQKGLNLLKDLGILKLLDMECENLVFVHDLSGMWAQINTSYSFEFTKIFQKEVNKIKEIIASNKIDEHTLFYYDLYPSLVASTILGISRNEVMKKYKNMKIHTSKELAINFLEIESILKKDRKTCEKMKNELISELLKGHLENDTDCLKKYVMNRGASFEL